MATDTPQVKHLKQVWRDSVEHDVEQLYRFCRLFAMSAVTPLLDLIVKGSGFDKETLLVLLVPIAETTWRQLHPALTASAVDSAPGTVTVMGPNEPTD